MNAQQLKNAILQEAIAGRLVPQDPNDEPASVLLARIRKEKERLVKEGKLKKKDLEVKPISEDEIPFEIPESWEWCKLGDIVTYQNGYSYNSSETNKVKKGLPVIKSGNIMTLDVVVKPNNDYVENPTTKMLASKIVKGDMLMCLSSQSDNPEPLGKTAIYKEERYALLNQRVLKFRPIIDELTSYLYYAINSFYFWYNVSHHGGGSAQANLTLYHVLDMLLPMPPLSELHRIVVKIEELLPKVEEYGKAQDALNKLNTELPERLKKSILQEAIEGRLVPQDPNDEPASVLLNKIRQEKAQLVKAGKLKKKDLIETPISEDEIPFEIPESWEWVRLGNISTYANTKKKINTATAAPNLWGLDLEDIEKGGRLLSFKSVGERKSIGDKTCFSEGEILYSKLRPYLLKILIAPKNGICTPEIIPFTCYGDICNEYIVNLLKSSYVDEYINSVTFGVKMPRVSTETMTSLVLPLPPLAEQHRIVEKLDQLLGEIDKLKK